MEKKIILLFIIISLVLISCDPTVGIKIVNDTNYPVGVKAERREEIIPPGEQRFVVALIGVITPTWLKEGDKERERIADMIRKYGSAFGVYITYFEENYHITPETLVYLMEHNARYETLLMGHTFYLNLSEVIGHVRLQALERNHACNQIEGDEVD